MMAIICRKLYCHCTNPLIIPKRAMNYFKHIKKWYKNQVERKPPTPPYNHVCQIGDPVLKIKCETVQADKIQLKEIQKVVKILTEVMRSYKAVAMSAPQIGIPLRIFVTEYPKAYMKHVTPDVQKTREIIAFPFKVFINPEIQVVNPQRIVFPEGCESIRGFSASVARFYEIEVNGYNENGIHHSWKVKGWPARIIQHECDHLDGKLYTDLMDVKTLQNDCWHWINVTNGKFQLNFI